MRDAARLLAQNAALTDRAERYGRTLRDHGDKRVREINDELASIPAGQTLLNEASAARYRKLVADRARLLHLT